MEERVPPGFADDQISPLDDHDAHKEAGVAGELDDLPLLVCLQVEQVRTTHSPTQPLPHTGGGGDATPTHPLLPIGVLQVVDVSMVPANANAQQRRWQEAVLSHDHKVGEEASQSLDHPCRQKVDSGPCFIILGPGTRLHVNALNSELER